MIKTVYGVGCPPEMGCMGKSCPQCWETIMECDICGCETDDLYRDLDTGEELCESCRDSRYEHIGGEVL